MLTIPGTMLQNEVLLRFYQRTWNCVGLEMEGAYYADQVTQSKVRRSGAQGPAVTPFLMHSAARGPSRQSFWASYPSEPPRALRTTPATCPWRRWRRANAVLHLAANEITGKSRPRSPPQPPSPLKWSRGKASLPSMASRAPSSAIYCNSAQVREEDAHSSARRACHSIEPSHRRCCEPGTPFYSRDASQAVPFVEGLGPSFVPCAPACHTRGVPALPAQSHTGWNETGCLGGGARRKLEPSHPRIQLCGDQSARAVSRAQVGLMSADDAAHLVSGPVFKVRARHDGRRGLAGRTVGATPRRGPRPIFSPQPLKPLLNMWRRRSHHL